MRVLTTIPQENLQRVPAAARDIEARGFDGIVTQENRHDPFLPLAVAAVNTSRVQLATGVAIAFARSPMSAANQSWDLQAASAGRFVLGLGSQVKGHNERRFSVPWSAPAPRMKEYVEALRAIFRAWKTGERLAYEGKHYRFTLMTPNFTPEAFDAPSPAVTIAAVGPAMLRVAGEVCDGVRLHGFCTRKYLEDVVMPELDEGRRRGGRSREGFDVTGGGFLVTGPDDASVAKMFEWVRYRVAFYGSTPAYWPVFAVHGLDDLGRKLNEMSKTGQWDRMAAEVPDDVVHLFCAAGRHDQIKAAIERRFGGISDAVFASMQSTTPSDLPPDVIQDIRAIPVRFAGYAAA